MKIVFCLFFSLMLISCSSSVTDPKEDKPNGTGLSYRPEITMYNFKGGEAYRANSSYRIRFKVLDEVMGVNESVIEYKRDSETNWTLIKDKILSSSEQMTEVVWNIPAGLSGNDFRLRITTYGKIPATKEIESVSAFTIDGGIPTLASGGLALNLSLPLTPFTFFKILSVSGDSDDLAGIGGYCFNASDAAVDESDMCWAAKPLVNSGAMPIYAGMLTQTQDVYLHLKDRAGNMRLNTNTVGDDKLAIVQSAVTIPSNSDSFYMASSSGNSNHHLGLTLQNTASSYNYSNFTNNNTQSVDPGAVAYLPSGAMLIRDRIKGLRKIDLVNLCSGVPCNSVIVPTSATSVDGLLNGTAKVVEPLRMFLGPNGILWLLDKKAAASSELVIRKIDFNDSQPQLVTVIGGGSKEDDTLESALDLKINYSEALVFYGAFQGLPNGWLVFHSTNPEAALNTESAGRYKIRIYKGSEAKKIQTIYLNTKNVYDPATHPGNDVIATSTVAATFDEQYQDVLNFYVRVCELTLPVSNGQSCVSLGIFGFEKDGQAQPSLQISSFVPDGNLVLESQNGSDMFAKSGISSELRRYDFGSSSWETLAGNGSRGSSYCLNGVANSACALRLKDTYYDPLQKLIYVLDESKVRMITPDVNKIYSLIE